MDIYKIKEMCQNGALRWTNHVYIRLIQRSISTEDVESALLSGEIIEEYPQDYPYPSYLVLGLRVSGEYIHVVCGLSPTELWIITTYVPDKSEWSDDLRIRKELTQ